MNYSISAQHPTAGDVDSAPEPRVADARGPLRMVRPPMNNVYRNPRRVSRRMPFVSLVIVMIILGIASISWGDERVRVIEWGDLLSPTSTEFDDPFLKAPLI